MNKQLKDDLQFVFGSEEGKRVFSWFIECGHLLHPVGNEINERETNIKLGERNFVLRILAALNWQPQDIVNLTKGEL